MIPAETAQRLAEAIWWDQLEEVLSSPKFFTWIHPDGWRRATVVDY